MHLHEHGTLAPAYCKILLQCRSCWLSLFDTSCPVPSLTAIAGTTNILLLLQEQGSSKQLLSQGREEKQQEGWPTLFQGSSVVTYARSHSENQYWLQSLCSLSPLSPASFPSAGSGWMQCRALSPQIHFQNAAAETVTSRGAWYVFKGLCFDSQIKEQLGSFDHPQGLATAWPKPRHRPALNCRCAGAIAIQTLPLVPSSLPPLLHLTQTLPIVQPTDGEDGGDLVSFPK